MLTLSETLPVSMAFRDISLVEESKKPLQNVRYFHSDTYGKILTIGTEVQHVEAWASFYHESLIHLPLAFVKTFKSALVLGGGSLFAARELLKYSSVERVILVDHDLDVIDLTLRVYPNMLETRSDNRFHIIEGDAVQYLLNSVEKFDIIVNDCFDGQRVINEREDVKTAILRLLTPQGLFSDVFYKSIYDVDATKKSIDAISNVRNKAFSLVAVPEYPGIFHILSMWGNNNSLCQTAVSSSNNEQYILFERNRFEHYSPNFLPYYLYIPRYVKKYVKDSLH